MLPGIVGIAGFAGADAGGGGGGAISTTAELGYNGGGLDNSDNTANLVRTQAYYVPKLGAVTCDQISVHLGASITNGAKVKAVIYDDSSNLVAEGTEVVLSSSDSNTTKVMPFAAPVSLTEGSWYHFGWIIDTALNVKGLGNGTTFLSNGNRSKAATYSSGAPASMSGFGANAFGQRFDARITFPFGVLGPWSRGETVDGTDGFFTYDITANAVHFIKLTTPSDIGTRSIDKIFARLSGSAETAGDAFKGVIYDSSGNLLGSSAEVLVSAITVDTDLEVTLSSPVSIAASTEYWIGIHTNGGSDVTTHGTGTTYTKSATYSSGVPGSISSPGNTTLQASFWARYS